MLGSYNLLLVFASYCVAVIAAYTAIYFGTKVYGLHGGMRRFWLGAGALCLGSGIWSMHFVGMSAYTMPGHHHMSFSAWLTFLSWIPAVVASALALYVITLPKASNRSIAASALIMGAGIFCMHYGGMYAMQMHPAIEYDLLLVILSGVIAVVASGAALVICRRLRDIPAERVFVAKLAAALMMGAAICGMHYTGMAAAIYPEGAATSPENLLRGNWMGIPTAIAASVLLLLALYVAYRDFAELERAREAQFKVQEDARQAAFFDTATGLANRNFLESRVLEKLTVSADQAASEHFSLVYFELTGYRDLASSNEEAARQLLTEFVARLQARLTLAEVLARYSGNGFIALTPALDSSALKSLLRQLSVDLCQPILHHGRPLDASWAFGVSNYPRSGSNSRNLIRAAQKIRTRFGERESETLDAQLA
jgi:NO-binding membrane sensor protein with MHYT domain/GGDEF domain-containing protein